MKIPPTLSSSVSFRSYDSPLKRDFKRGLFKLPQGAYGDDLTPDNVSIEHIIPRSKGGKSKLENYMLVSKEMNRQRGNKPLVEHLKFKPFLKYILIMLEVNTKEINGVRYVKAILCTVLKALNNNL